MLATVLAVDPGLTGGLCVINHSKEILALLPMPTIGDEISPHKLADVIKDLRFQHHVGMCFLERAGCRPGQSAQSGLKTGRNYGILEGVIASLGLPYQEVSPQRWSKQLQAIKAKPGASDAEKYKARKERNVREAIKLFPNVSFLATERSKVPHMGLVDAALIAYYGVGSI